MVNRGILTGFEWYGHIAGYVNVSLLYDLVQVIGYTMRNARCRTLSKYKTSGDRVDIGEPHAFKSKLISGSENPQGLACLWFPQEVLSVEYIGYSQFLVDMRLLTACHEL